MISGVHLFEAISGADTEFCIHMGQGRDPSP
jgi:hypothetical protein